MFHGSCSTIDVAFTYLQACYFDRDDVALSGFGSFFKKASDEEHKHADRFLQYQNTRGGRIVLQDIKVTFNLLSPLQRLCPPLW